MLILSVASVSVARATSRCRSRNQSRADRRAPPELVMAPLPLLSILVRCLPTPLPLLPKTARLFSSSCFVVGKVVIVNDQSCCFRHDHFKNRASGHRDANQRRSPRTKTASPADLRLLPPPHHSARVARGGTRPLEPLACARAARVAAAGAERLRAASRGRIF